MCDGTNNTLDLRNLFVVGAGDTYNVGSTGGYADTILLSHNHTVTINSVGNHGHSITGRYNYGSGGVQGTDFRGQFTSTYTRNVNAAGAHSHTVSINNAGSSATNANLPPYYALAFIQQIS